MRSDARWNILMEPVARLLLGEPNAELSSQNDIRFGSKGSFSVNRDKGAWYDYERNEGGSVLDLIRREVPGVDALEWLENNGFEIPRTNGKGSASEIVTSYDYTDETNTLLFQVVRTDIVGQPKRIRQRRPDGRGGWLWKLEDTRRVLYRLPELIASDPSIPIHIAEGEKKVDALRGLGLVATCNVGGADKWRDEYSEVLRGRDVIILPDNDDAGTKHGQSVTESLSGIAASIKIVILPNLPTKGDVIDWLDAGGTREELERIIQAAPIYAAPEAELEPDRAPPFSDEALALQFVRDHAANLRHVATWGRWLEWCGDRWIADETLKVFDLARRTCRAAASEVSAGSRSIASAKTVAAVERLARADRRVAATSDQWDADQYVINGRGGAIELRTAERRASRREDHFTMICGTEMLRGPIPLWDSFLTTVTAGDENLRSYLRRVAGYCLTGDTREHVIFFLHGTGANGKSVFLNTLAGVWGDYATSVPTEVLMESKSDRHPTELARLRGPRLAIASETEEGRRWAESRIKMLTGGDRIAARFMRQDFFEFTPRFKLMICGNHKPSLRGVDEAIRRRMHLIPFTVTIPQNERDPDLVTKLRAESPGILAWAVDGCLEWQRDGLKPPPAVVEATKSYLDTQDGIGAWIDECWVRDAKGWTPRSKLFQSWSAWAQANGEFVGNRSRFIDAMEARGFEPKKRGEIGFLGIRCLTQEEVKGKQKDRGGQEEIPF